MLKLIKQLKSVLEERMRVNRHVPRAVSYLGLKSALKHLSKIKKLPIDLDPSYYISDEIRHIEKQIKKLDPEVKLIHKIYFRLLQVEKWLESRKKSDHDKFAKLYGSKKSKIFRFPYKKRKEEQDFINKVVRSYKKGRIIKKYP